MSVDLRPIGATDLAAVHALCRAVEAADGVPVATPIEEFREWLEDPHLDMSSDTRLVETDGAPVAWGRIWHRPSGVRQERAFMLGGVAPAHRRRGIGSALLRWQIQRATELLRGNGSALPRHVRAQAYDFQESALRLYARHGLAPVRWSVEMLRELAAEHEPIVPQGVHIVPWDPARSEESRVAENESFADHWGSAPLDRTAWEHDLDSFGKRLDLSFLALADDRVVGVCRNAHFPGDEAVTSRRDGWIMRVSVVRAHRGRGIGSALIARSMHAFRAAGLTHAALGVDTENPSGAYALYGRLGFRTVSRIIVHQLSV